MKSSVGPDNKYEPATRTPVQRAFYESLLFNNRWSVTRLYAQNITASQDFKSELRHMGYERKTSLRQMDHEIDMMRRDLRQFHVDSRELLYLPTKLEDELLSDSTERLPILESAEKGGKRVKFKSRQLAVYHRDREIDHLSRRGGSRVREISKVERGLLGLISMRINKQKSEPFSKTEGKEDARNGERNDNRVAINGNDDNHVHSLAKGNASSSIRRVAIHDKLTPILSGPPYRAEFYEKKNKLESFAASKPLPRIAEGKTKSIVVENKESGYRTLDHLFRNESLREEAGRSRPNTSTLAVTETLTTADAREKSRFVDDDFIGRNDATTIGPTQRDEKISPNDIAYKNLSFMMDDLTDRSDATKIDTERRPGSSNNVGWEQNGLRSAIKRKHQLKQSKLKKGQTPRFRKISHPNRPTTEFSVDQPPTDIIDDRPKSNLPSYNATQPKSPSLQKLITPKEEHVPHLPSLLEIRERRGSTVSSRKKSVSNKSLTLPPLSHPNKKYYEKFYDERDLQNTTARYISRCMKVNISRLVQPLSTT